MTTRAGRYGKNRRAAPLYTRICIAIARQSKTIGELADELDAERMAIGRALRCMRGRIVYVERYVRPRRGRPMAEFRLGQAPDCKAPKAVEEFSERMSLPLVRGREMASFIAYVEALFSGPATMPELIDASGMGRQAAVRILRALRAAGMVNVQAWDRKHAQGCWVAGYGIGIDEPDEVKPRAQPRKKVEKLNNAAASRKRAQVRVLRAIAGQLRMAA